MEHGGDVERRSGNGENERGCADGGESRDTHIEKDRQRTSVRKKS